MYINCKTYCIQPSKMGQHRGAYLDFCALLGCLCAVVMCYRKRALGLFTHNVWLASASCVLDLQAQRRKGINASSKRPSRSSGPFSDRIVGSPLGHRVCAKGLWFDWVAVKELRFSCYTMCIYCSEFDFLNSNPVEPTQVQCISV